ncbi:MAG: VOC family protein [Phycisphaerae bacterium]
MLHNAQLVGFTATSQPEEARRFYKDVLGLRLIEETSFAIVFDANGVVVRVQKTHEVHPAPHTLIGWEVEDIAATARQLQALGVAFERFDQLEQDDTGIWHAPGGARVAWFKDPDGNLLSLSQSA